MCERVLCCFCAHLANEKLKHKTIKVYLSAVQHMQIAAGQNDPFGAGSVPMSKLEYVLRGIKMNEAAQQKGEGERARLPITPPLLLRIKAMFESDVEFGDRKMLGAACCICILFFRVGEMTAPSDKGFDPAVHLGIGEN